MIVWKEKWTKKFTKYGHQSIYVAKTAGWAEGNLRESHETVGGCPNDGDNRREKMCYLN